MIPVLVFKDKPCFTQASDTVETEAHRPSEVHPIYWPSGKVIAIV